MGNCHDSRERSGKKELKIRETYKISSFKKLKNYRFGFSS